MKRGLQFNSILIVDDDEISSLVSSVMLQKAEIDAPIRIVYNGRQAIDYLRRECVKSKENTLCPALLFLDLNMPIMDGFEFLEAFSHDDQLKQINVCIFVLTSSAHWEDEKRATKYPVAGYITKPITAEKIYSIFHLTPSG